MSLAALSDLPGPWDDSASFAPDALALAEFPTPIYSRKQVVNAGKALLQPMPWDEGRAPEYRMVFKIAYDWRSSHAYPMRQMRQELRSLVLAMRRGGVTAARLKRMSSVRKKLERLDATLVQIQDIGGCRAIVDSIATVNDLLVQYRSGERTRHKLRQDRSYIEEPRITGYRSHHMVFDFQPDGAEEEPYRDRRIEIQLRSTLQHSWATAVEAVGLNQNQDLKAGEGDENWLRFFQLVSAGFADFEGTAPVPYTPERAERIAELGKLERALNAVPRLEALNEAFRYLEKNRKNFATYYMLQFDNVAKTLDISSYDRIVRAAERYGEAEQSDNVNTVVVEVDTLEALKEAYPNYFMDVRLFTQNVVRMLGDLPLVRRVSEEQKKKTALGHDVGWLRKYFPAMYREN